MSKKKGQQKKEIVAAFVPGYFWEYKIGTSENAEKVNTFINTFQNQLKALVDPAKSFQENYKMLAQKMGINVHPSLQVDTKQQSKFPTLKNKDYGEKFVVFLSYKIDIVTLKLFGFLISQYKLNCLKLSNNNLEAEQASQLVKILEKDDSLINLYFQWNPMPAIQNKKDIILATARPSLQHLLLRECKMGNQIFTQFINKIKAHPEQKIKSLDLYGNQLTNDVMQQICKFVEESKTIEFLGISRNSLNSQQFISKLFNSIGQIPLSQQQYQQHKQKQKQRDQIIQKNKKRKKGAPQQPVPFVFDVKQTPEGRFYVKNTTLKVLNISSNGLTDNLVPLIRNFAEKQGKNIELFIEGNKFSKKNKQTLKFFENIIL